MKHFFIIITETKGSMDSLQLKPIEQVKKLCAKKLYKEVATMDVKYHDVDSYESLFNIMQTVYLNCGRQI